MKRRNRDIDWRSHHVPARPGTLACRTGPDAPIRTTLSNDRPEFPIGFAKDRQLLEDVNQAAIKDPIRVGGLMEQAAKQGDLVPIPSGTKAKPLATRS